jgi:hypothetical protein
VHRRNGLSANCRTPVEPALPHSAFSGYHIAAAATAVRQGAQPLVRRLYSRSGSEHRDLKRHFAFTESLQSCVSDIWTVCQLCGLHVDLGQVIPIPGRNPLGLPEL